jgi:hypothetical protein
MIQTHAGGSSNRSNSGEFGTLANVESRRTRSSLRALKFFRSNVVCLRWNDASHTSPRVRVIARPTRNQMQVAVHHGLTGDFCAVDSYVETRHGGVRLLVHSFYKAFLNTGSGSLFEPQTISEILKHLAASNAKSGIHRHILPGRLAAPVDTDWLKFQQLIIDSAQTRFGSEPLIATVALSQASVESEEQVEAVVEAAHSWSAGVLCCLREPARLSQR